MKLIRKQSLVLGGLCLLAAASRAESEMIPPSAHISPNANSVLSAASAPARQDRVDINNVPNDVSPAFFIEMLDGFLEKEETDLLITKVRQSQLDRLATYIRAKPGQDYLQTDTDMVLNASFLCKFLDSLKGDTPVVLVGAEKTMQARQMAEQVTKHKLAKAFFFDNNGNCGKGIVKSLKLTRCGNERILDLDLNPHADAFVGRRAQLDTEMDARYVQDLDRERLDPFKKMNLNLELGGKSDEGKMRFVLRQARTGLGKDLAARSQELLNNYKSIYLWDELKTRVEAATAGKEGKRLRWPQAACVLKPEVCQPYSGFRNMEERIAYQDVSIEELNSSLESAKNPARDEDIRAQLAEMDRKGPPSGESTGWGMKKNRLQSELNLRERWRTEIPKLFKKLDEERAFYNSVVGGGFAKNADATQLIIPENISNGCAPASSDDPPNGKLGLSFRTMDNKIQVTSSLKEVMHHPGPPATVFSRMRTELEF